MKNASQNKQSVAGRQSMFRPGAKATTKPKNQRAEPKITPTQALEDSELRYRRLFEAAQDGILILDAQTGAIDDVNPYLIKMLGYSRSEFVKKKLWEVGVFKDVDASKIAFKVLQENEYIRYENLPLRAKRGQLIQVEFVSNVYLVGARKVIQCNIRDITEHKQVNDTLRASDKLYRRLFENMLNGFAYCKMIFEHDRPQDFIFLDVNSAFESLTGLKDVVTKKVSEVIPGIRESDPGLFEIYGRVALTGNPERFETYLEALKMWFSISVYSPQKEYFVAVFDVITERKQAEEEIKNLAKFPDENPYPILRLNVEGTILYANKASEAVLKEWKTEIGRKAPPFWLKKATEVFESRSQQVIDVLIGLRVLSFVITPISGVSYVNFYGRDITERKQAEEELKLFRTLIDQSSDAIEVVDPETGRFLDVNEKECLELGYSRKELLSLGVLDIDPLLPSSLFPISEESAKTIPVMVEGIHQRKDGSTFPVEVSLKYIQLDRDYVVTVVRDITERKQTEKALLASEARYRVLFENSPISLWEEDFSAVKQRLDTLREEGITIFSEYFKSHPGAVAELAASIKVVDVNKATMKMFGADYKDDLLKSRAELFNIEQNQDFANEFINIAEGKTQFSWEGSNKTIDGRVIAIALNWSSAPGYENSLSKVVVSMIDITERNRSAEQLVNERNLLRTLIDNLPDAVYVKDTEGRFMLKNLLDAQQMGASSSDETIGKTDFDYYSPELAAQYQADDQAVFQSGQPIINHEEPIVDATGHSGWVQTTKVPLRDTQGKVIGLVGIGHNITERKQAEIKIKQQLERLAALRTIDQVVTSSFDLHISLTMILNQVTRELGVDAADVMLLNGTNLFLEYSAGVGFRTKAAEKATVRLGQNFAGRVALERQLIQIPDLHDQPDDFLLKTLLAGENFKCYFGVPLVAKGIVKGVLELYHRTPLQPDQEWLDFLNTLAEQTAIAIDNAHLFDNLQRSNINLTLAYDATIEGWSRAMDLRDKETEGHTQRVTEMTMELAGLFGIKDEELVGIRRGALLHDIGKMGVPDAILLKPAALTAEEWVIMRMHPTLAFEMLSPINYLKSAIDIPYCHHEKWDGTGYPRGLKGELIPLSARIFAIVDVWDAVTSDRPYRQAWSKEKAIDYLRSQSGMHFDPQILKVCLEARVFDRKASN